MTFADGMMLLAAVLGGASALLVVTSRNVVHAALYLVVTMLSVALAFLAIGAEFLAWAQVLVYVGAVVVLILFGLMLTRAPIGPMAQHNENRRLAFGVSVVLFGFLATVTYGAFGDTQITLAPTTTAQIGEFLYIDWAFPFMVLGFFLTVALIGAIIIARREEGEGPLPAADEQARREPSGSDVTTAAGRWSGDREVPARTGRGE
ncbi:MAG: NADH-quinone oxidoreductase subunit J family protein [Egibacteraceae bacterium]